MRPEACVGMNVRGFIVHIGSSAKSAETERPVPCTESLNKNKVCLAAIAYHPVYCVLCVCSGGCSLFGG